MIENVIPRDSKYENVL